VIRRTWDHTTLTALGLAFIAFAASALVSQQVFQRLPHLEDELAYVWQAHAFAQGDLTLDSPTPRQPYWQPFVIDYQGQRFSKYTPGWSAVLALGSAGDQLWVINAALAALTVALTYRLGRGLFGAEVGMIAALLLAASPMALLLNGSLMGHTLALCCATGFMWAFFQLVRARRARRWGAIAGVCLGLLTIARPLTAVGIVLPFILYSLWLIWRGKFVPLVILGIVTLAIAALLPAYRWVATGDPTLNAYALVWSYDRVGFGAEFGRGGHTLQKGIRNARHDLTLAAVDLFGWQWGRFTDEQRDQIIRSSGAYPGIGLSGVLLPLGVIIGLRRRPTWALILLGVVVGLIGVHLAYWIGSQRYSTRYYSEALSAAALLSAVPVGMWMSRCRNRWQWWATLLLMLTITAAATVNYTIPRLGLLRGFNGVSYEYIMAINALRQTDAPLLVIVSGESLTWRAAGSLMVITTPHLDSDIVLARDTADGRFREAILARFPDREVIDLHGAGSHTWLAR
jgi:4-amino-4-deoxy-L-arabinose transferase-like glycosyltransferase